MFSCMFYFKFYFESLEFSNIWDFKKSSENIYTSEQLITEWLNDIPTFAKIQKVENQRNLYPISYLGYADFQPPKI